MKNEKIIMITISLKVTMTRTMMMAMMVIMMMTMIITLNVISSLSVKVYLPLKVSHLYISSDLLGPSTVEVGNHSGNFPQCFYSCDYKSHY